MISMYELKLGNEKLEALKFLLENTKDLTTALQGLDVSGLKSETSELKETIAKATALNQNLKELRAHLENNDFSALLAAYNEAKPRLDGFSEKMNGFDEKYAKIEGAVANLPEIKTKIEQAAQLLENALPTLTAKIDEFNEKLAQGQTKLDQTSQDFSMKYNELVTLKSELETLKGEINTLLLQGVINDTQTATTTTFSSVKIKAEMDALKSQIPDTANLLTSETAEQTYAKKAEIPDVSGKLDTDTAETTYAKKIEIPNVSGFLKSEVAEQTYMKKGEVPNIEGLPTMEKIEQTFAKKDDVNLALATKLGKNEQASDSAMLEGNAASAFVKIDNVSSEATANKIVKRAEDGGIYASGINTTKLNLSSSVEDGALATNSIVLFSENGSELVRKASVSKLKELVTSETVENSNKLGGIAATEYAKKNELPNTSNFVKKVNSELSRSTDFSTYSTFSLSTADTSLLYTQLCQIIPYINIPHSSPSGGNAFPENISSSGEINFDLGINFVTSRALSQVTALNHNTIRNRGKSGLICINSITSGFSADYKLLNPEDFTDKKNALFSYFISPFDSKIYLQFAGNLK